MRNVATNSGFKTATLAALLTASAGLSCGAFAAAESDLDFANPAYAITRDAVIASGTCIARCAGQAMCEGHFAVGWAGFLHDRKAARLLGFLGSFNLVAFSA